MRFHWILGKFPYRPDYLFTRYGVPGAHACVQVVCAPSALWTAWLRISMRSRV